MKKSEATGRKMGYLLMTLAVSLSLLSGCSPMPAAPSPATAIPTPEDPEAALPAQLAASAPAVNIRFERIGVENGLSQSVVTCFLQDRQGFLWVGTQDGLNRYDGYSFKVFQPDPNDPYSLSDRWINSILQDHDGFIWIGTRLGGLDRYDPVTGEFSSYQNDPAVPSSLISNQVQVLLEDSQNQLWVGTAEGLDRYSPSRKGFEHYSFHSLPTSERISDDITALFEDSAGNLWVGTAYAGLNRYDKASGSFINHASVPGNATSLTSNDIRSIQEDPAGRLWVATSRGLNLFDPKTGRAVRYLHGASQPGSLAGNLVRVIYMDHYGNLWVGTGDGLDRYEGITGQFIHYNNIPGVDTSLSSDSITAIGETSDGVLWFGSYGGGLNKYYRGQDFFKYYHYAASGIRNLSGKNVQGLSIDPSGAVWISTLDGGLDRLDPASGMLKRYQNNLEDPGSLSSNEVYSVYTDHNGTLWVGTAVGLDMLAPGSSAFTHFRHNPTDPDSLIGAPVYTILEDERLNLWVGTEFGLEQLDRSERSFLHFQSIPGDSRNPSGNEIKTLFLDQAGGLWIGTFNDGLNRLDPTTGQFTYYLHDPQDPDSLSNNSVLSLQQDSRGTLWVGTAGGGLDRFEISSGSFDHFGDAEGLPNDVIFGILEDGQGYLWLSTNHGLSRFDPLGEQSVRNYTANDGLQGNEFNPNAYAKGLEGQLYFGGTNGLTAFDPAVIADSPFLPQVVLVSITHNGLPLNTTSLPEMTSDVILRWPQNSFEFEYAALGYAQPGKNQYAYMLEGLETVWNEVGTRRAGRYTNLAGGDYTLRIKASNQDGLWNEAGTIVRVKVIPPVWQTTSFRLFLAGLVAALALVAYWGRARSIRAYNRQLEREVRDRTQEIERLFEKTRELAVVEERNRLARELHDSAKQKAFAALAQLGTANGLFKKDPRQASSHLTEAENLVYEVIEELTFLIQEMYPAALKEKGLATTLREYVFEWEGRTDIQADVRIDHERPLRLEVEQAIYRMIQEALSNVSRHSQAKRVEVVLSYSKDEVVVIVADDGCGFNPATAPNGVGLRSIRERIESIGGTVTIESSAECGARLTAHIPLANQEVA
jgi:ligand-binding sensor domain-containing protein/signal transduction histidine kinase